jgi:hypothetical protein
MLLYFCDMWSFSIQEGISYAAYDLSKGTAPQQTHSHSGRNMYLLRKPDFNDNMQLLKHKYVTSEM